MYGLGGSLALPGLDRLAGTLALPWLAGRLAGTLALPSLAGESADIPVHSDVIKPSR